MNTNNSTFADLLSGVNATKSFFVDDIKNLISQIIYFYFNIKPNNSLQHKARLLLNNYDKEDIRVRWLKNLILTLLILIIFIYLIIQTQWGAKQLSDLLSKHTQHDVKIGGISHHLTTPGEIVLQDVAIHNKQNNFKLNTKQITFELLWEKIFSGSWLHQLVVTEGELTLPFSRQIFLFSRKILQLENMNVNYRIGNIGLLASNITGGITPGNQLLITHLGREIFNSLPNSLRLIIFI